MPRGAQFVVAERVFRKDPEAMSSDGEGFMVEAYWWLATPMTFHGGWQRL